MTMISWLILMLIVILGTAGQLSLKYSIYSNTSSKKQLLSSYYFWFWLFCYVVVTGLWLVVLRTLPLSQAFPALGLTFAFVPLASNHFLKEKVLRSQWLGISIIVAGVCLVVQN